MALTRHVKLKSVDLHRQTWIPKHSPDTKEGFLWCAHTCPLSLGERHRSGGNASVSLYWSGRLATARLPAKIESLYRCSGSTERNYPGRRMKETTGG